MPTNDPPPAHPPSEGRFTFTTGPPPWAQHLQRTINQILTNQEKQMAAIDDVNKAIASLRDAVNQALQDLKDQAAAGGIGPDDVQSVIDQLNATHDQIIAGLPPAHTPTTGPTPATP